MKQFSLNFRGRSHRVDGPIVMGIMNATPDSFYAGSRTPADAGDALRRRAAVLLEQGADVIDVGGYSTRPGAPEVSVSEELRRVEAGIGAVRRLSSSIPVSVDTFRSEVANRPPSSWTMGRISGGMTGSTSMIIHSGLFPERRKASTTSRRLTIRAFFWPEEPFSSAWS